MDPSNRNTWGSLIDKAELRIGRTRALVKVADKLEYVRLIAAYQEIVSSDKYIETLVVEVEAELPQMVQNDMTYMLSGRTSHGSHTRILVCSTFPKVCVCMRLLKNKYSISYPASSLKT
jgi:hypothetical protein